MTDFEKLEMIANMPLVCNEGMDDYHPYVQGQHHFQSRIRQFLAEPEAPVVIDG